MLFGVQIEKNVIPSTAHTRLSPLAWPWERWTVLLVSKRKGFCDHKSCQMDWGNVQRVKQINSVDTFLRTLNVTAQLYFVGRKRQ